MNPETQSTRAKITQTSANDLVQAIVDSSRRSQDRLNSGDVGLRRSAGSGISTERQDSRRLVSGGARHAGNSRGDSGVSGSWAA